MNVCVICNADGVLEALGAWYCMEHLEDGFIEIAMFIARLRGVNEWDIEALAQGWIEEFSPIQPE